MNLNESAVQSRLPSRLTRRRALETMAGAGVSLLAAKLGRAAVALPKPETIDPHSHIWTRDVKRFPLTKGSELKDLDPPSFTVAELKRVMGQHDVSRAVLIQHHIYHGYDNSYLLDAARRFPQTFRVVGMLDDLQPDPATRMRHLLKAQVTGFRITSWIRKKKWLTGPGMESMWKCAAETGQAICCLMDPPDLPSLGAMCWRHPDTPVVIDHFARIGVDGQIRDADVTQLCRLARHKNTHVKISAYYALGAKKAPYLDLLPMIRRVLDSYGPSRCMWASDSPYQLQGGHTYGSSLALVTRHCDFLSVGDRAQILGKTAEKVYFA
jgi:predicted TIM-barrel fold metal-dependent hydrolase